MPDLAPTANGGVVRVPDTEYLRDPVDARTGSDLAPDAADRA
jgi:hypothetical protein